MQLRTTPVALNGEQSYSGFCLQCLNNSCSKECKLGTCLTYVHDRIYGRARTFSHEKSRGPVNTFKSCSGTIIFGFLLSQQ